MMKKIGTILTLLICFVSLQLFGQNIQIRGAVSDAMDNSPIPGVTIVVKGTNTVTTTLNDGTFVLTAPTDAVLVFSFIGMTAQEIPVEGRSIINVIMNSSTTLQEVVVTALGISREKKSLGYATQDVKGEKLNMTGNADLTKSLQGKVVGVELKTSSGMPGASSQIVIRGARSFTGNNTPLYVIDGMPVSSTAPYSTGNSVTGSDITNRAIDIDPNDIESINILRGQAAAALYGLRASNGAVIITTKSGKGQTVGKTNVSITQVVSFDMVSRSPEYQQLYTQGNGGVFPTNGTSSMAWGPLLSSMPDHPVLGGNKSVYSGKYQVPQLVRAGLEEGKTYVKPQTYDNWNDYFRTGIQSTSSISLSRAETNGHFAMGISYNDQTGIALNTGMQKWNAKASAEKKLNNAFTVGFSSNFMRNNIDKLSGANDGALAGVIAAPPSYNLKGIPYHVPGDPYSQIYYRSLTFDNPYWVQYNNTFNEGTDRFFGNMYVQYSTQLADDHKLTLKYQLGVDSFTTHYKDIMGFGHSGGAGYIDDYGSTLFNYNSLITANYDWKISPELDFNLIVGNELDHSYWKDYTESGDTFNFGGWNHIQNTTTQQTFESVSQSRTVGFFGSASLSYLNMIYLNATARQDVSSAMPPNNRNFFYPSVSLGFLFSELDAFRKFDWFSFGKLRASYAEVGAASSRYYESYYYQPGYGGSWWKNAPILYPLNGVGTYVKSDYVYDPNLHPQNTKTWEVGVQLNFIQNRIGIDYTYANQNTVDQIFAVPLPGSNGASSMVTNGGQMKTNTHELALNGTPIQTNDFRWDLSVNFTKMKNEVVSLREGVESIFLGGFTEPQVRAGIGSSYPIIYGTTWIRDDKGRVLVDEDPSSMTYGMPMAGEPGEIGKVAPDFILGLNTMLSYKWISLGATFEWKQGGHMYSGLNGLNDMYGVSKRTEDRTSTFVYDGYKKDGTPNDIVRGGPNDPDAYEMLFSNVIGNYSAGYVYGNSFIKLRELSLRYVFPKSIFPKIDVAVSAFARNLLLWTELPYADPEASQGNNNMMGAFERFSLPQTRSFGFGININF
ncbi:MAG: SusC/RagA family TonB-linked outer membrane protein [Prevotellaceae bacterium]|jgi:TonB-linked SusC/RagA family outer membrane protein|nr:SusC/RagA family TonB-linked outer membrane protein [Prevotellaceae bacterium]